MPPLGSRIPAFCQPWELFVIFVIDLSLYLKRDPLNWVELKLGL